MYFYKGNTWLLDASCVINITMSGMERKPVEKTMAFGGVATGNMKAKEHAMVAEIIRYSGWNSMAID